ncbi:hypothetical protein ACFRFU_18635 [Streptomyces sp. NPDC056704]|uniref:hypothetical protein n=1 Tax=Streptomyces sp. NPDC056704 TaxID=3345917 RepID=UPI0036CCB193
MPLTEKGGKQRPKPVPPVALKRPSATGRRAVRHGLRRLSLTTASPGLRLKPGGQDEDPEREGEGEQPDAPG